MTSRPTASMPTTLCRLTFLPVSSMIGMPAPSRKSKRLNLDVGRALDLRRAVSWAQHICSGVFTSCVLASVFKPGTRRFLLGQTVTTLGQRRPTGAVCTEQHPGAHLAAFSLGLSPECCRAKPTVGVIWKLFCWCKLFLGFRTMLCLIQAPSRYGLQPGPWAYEAFIYVRWCVVCRSCLSTKEACELEPGPLHACSGLLGPTWACGSWSLSLSLSLSLCGGPAKPMMIELEAKRHDAATAYLQLARGSMQNVPSFCSMLHGVGSEVRSKLRVLARDLELLESTLYLRSLFAWFHAMKMFRSETP